jgi:hypothetical protein
MIYIIPNLDKQRDICRNIIFQFPIKFQDEKLHKTF